MHTDRSRRFAHSSHRGTLPPVLQAAARLRQSPYPEVRRVSCDFHDGVLTLRGRVSSYHMKQMAQVAAGAALAAHEFNNQVEVLPAR